MYALVGLACTDGTSYLQPGFRSVGIWDETRGMRLDLAVWYPVNTPPREMVYGNWIISVGRGTRPAYGLFPLIVISHDSIGSRFSHHNLAANLCRKGYIVVAPTHQGDNDEDMSRMFSARQITGRVDEARMAIDRILDDPYIGPSVDTSRMAVIGFGAGATTALLMAGARLDGSFFAGYCDPLADGDPYCTPWIRPRMHQLADDSSIKASFSDERIKLAVAVSPSYSMLFVPESLDEAGIPIFLIQMGDDRLNASPRYIEGLRTHLPPHSLYGMLENASNALLIAPCSTSIRYGGTSAECTPEILRQQEALYYALSEKLTAFIAGMGRTILPPPPKAKKSDKKQHAPQAVPDKPYEPDNETIVPEAEVEQYEPEE
jgi:predicted dienelactone hydrolase